MIHVLISGDVQGVGFRQFIRYNARKLNIKGWVKNLSNGQVEGMYVGEEENLQKMIDYSKKGPAIAIVKDIKIEEMPDQEFEGFDIIKE